MHIGEGAQCPHPTNLAIGRIELNKPDFCGACPITKFTNSYCPNELKPDTHTLFVGEAPGENEVLKDRPFIGGAGSVLDNMLRSAGIARESISIANTIGCNPPNNVFPGDKDWTHTSRQDAYDAIEYCRTHHLEPVLRDRPWRRIVALGNQALRVLTGRNGILLWRGSPLQLRDQLDKPPVVMPTLHPAYLMRNATLFSACKGDLKRGLGTPTEKYTLWATLEDLKRWQSKVFAFDLEWDFDGTITLCGLADRFYSGLVIGFDNPAIRAELKRIFEEATDLIGHNIIGADLPHFRKLGWNVTARLHDTMLKQHLVQPDYRHDLATVASIFTNRVFWKGKHGEDEDLDIGEGATGANVYGALATGNRSTGEQWRTWDSPHAIPREYGGYGGCPSSEEAYRLYNARDTAASFEINSPLDTRLALYEMEHVYWNVSVPAGHICQELGERGFKIDPLRVAEVRAQLEREISELELQLPEGLHPYQQPVMRREPAPPGFWKLKTKKCKGTKRDNTAHPPREIVFSNPTTKACPDCGRSIDSGPMSELRFVKKADHETVRPWNSSQAVLAYAKSKGCKPVHHKKTKRETSDKTARKLWARDEAAALVAKGLRDAKPKDTEFALIDNLKKRSTLRNSFAKEGLTKTDRMFFNLLVHGTAEGRLSSSARRKGIDLNVQNIPESARVLFLPDHPGWFIANLDWKSGENNLTAWLARDFERLERLRSPGYDEHAELATRIFACTVTKSNENKWMRAGAKVINHGLNYGMGIYHMQSNLSDEGFNYTIADVKEMVEEWKRLNPGTARWQYETTRICKQQGGYLKNVFGRKRWFTQRDFATKALAFLPASTLADMMLRCMIAMYASRFGNQLLALNVPVTGNLPPHCRLITQVHDSVVVTGPVEEQEACVSTIEAIMTQKFPELGGFSLEVDSGFSTESWGACK